MQTNDEDTASCQIARIASEKLLDLSQREVVDGLPKQDDGERTVRNKRKDVPGNIDIFLLSARVTAQFMVGPGNRHSRYIHTRVIPVCVSDFDSCDSGTTA